MVVIGSVLLVVGTIMTPLPPPFAFGIVLVLIGLAILAAWSKTARRWMQKGRERFPSLSDRLERVSPRLPDGLRRTLKRTSPAPLRRLHRLREGLRLRRLRKRSHGGPSHDGPAHATSSSSGDP